MYHRDLCDYAVAIASAKTLPDLHTKHWSIWINNLENIKNEYPDRKFVAVSFTDIDVKNDSSGDIKFDGYIEVENIFRYCDLISSVYGYISVHSGGTTLSAALKEYSPESLSFEDLPVEETMRSFFKNPEQFI